MCLENLYRFIFWIFWVFQKFCNSFSGESRLRVKLSKFSIFFLKELEIHVTWMDTFYSNNMFKFLIFLNNFNILWNSVYFVKIDDKLMLKIMSDKISYSCWTTGIARIWVENLNSECSRLFLCLFQNSEYSNFLDLSFINSHRTLKNNLASRISN